MCEQKTTADSKVDRLIDELSSLNELLRELVQRFDARHIPVVVPAFGSDMGEIVAPILRECSDGSLKGMPHVR